MLHANPGLSGILNGLRFRVVSIDVADGINERTLVIEQLRLQKHLEMV